MIGFALHLWCVNLEKDFLRGANKIQAVFTLHCIFVFVGENYLEASPDLTTAIFDEIEALKVTRFPIIGRMKLIV